MAQITEHPKVTTLSVSVLPESKAQFVDWQAKFNSLIAGSEGFVSLEFLAPLNPMDSWFIVQRFKNVKSLSSWHSSSTYHELLKELTPFVRKDSLTERELDEYSLKSGVTEVIITKIDPQKESAYREFCAKIHRLEAKFEGFRGVYIQSPAAREGNHWITLLQFNTPENLDRWLNSKEREIILKEASPMISTLESHRIASPYAGWFYSIAKTEEVPPAWKQAMVVLLSIFPIVMLESKYLFPLTASWDSATATFFANVISVGLLTFPLMPLAIRSLNWWLSPKEGSKLKTNILGTAFVLLLYLLEIALFWHFI